MVLVFVQDHLIRSAGALALSRSHVQLDEFAAHPKPDDDRKSLAAADKHVDNESGKLKPLDKPRP